MGLLSSYKDHSVKITHPERIIHEERRAATDDSIRLAKEYEEKIHSQIAEKLMVQGNLVNYSLSFQNDYIHPKMYIKIKINDQEFSQVFKVPFTCDELLKMIQEWLCEKILMDSLRSICEAYASGTISNYKVVNGK